MIVPGGEKMHFRKRQKEAKHKKVREEFFGRPPHQKVVCTSENRGPHRERMRDYPREKEVRVRNKYRRKEFVLWVLLQ